VAAGEGVQPSALSREEELLESRSGLVSLGGGKLTTYRRVAIRVVDRLASELEARHGVRARRKSGTNRLPLPGAEGASTADSEGADSVIRFLGSRYGSRAREILARIEGAPDLAKPIGPKSPDLRAEAWYGAAAEMAIRVEDVLRRRTQVALRSVEAAATAADDVAGLMAEPLGWDRATVRRRAAEYDGAEDDSPARRKA